MMSFLPSVAEFTPEQRAIYDMLPLDLTRGLLLTRSNAAPYLSLGQSFHESSLPARIRELIILRVGAVTGTDYEIAHHVPQARGCGVPDDMINAVLAGSRTLGSENLDALMEFVDELLGSVKSSPPSVEAIQKHYSRNEIAEIVLLVGHYVMTSLFVKTLDIQPENAESGDAASPPTVVFTDGSPSTSGTDER